MSGIAAHPPAPLHKGRAVETEGERLPEAMPAMSDRARAVGFAVMVLGMFMALLDIQIVAASLKQIGGGLSASVEEMAWVQTSYLIAEIIMIPLSGWLTQVMSTRWLFAASAAGFTLASMLCGAAWNIESMIVFRAMQGFLGGSMIPTVFTVAFTLFPPGQRTIAAATVGVVGTLGPVLGPVLGGWISEVWSWQWLFYINIVPGVAVAVLVPMLIRMDRPDWSMLRRADYPGILFLALALGCLEYTLEEGPRRGWLDDGTLRNAAWVSALAGIAFIWRSLRVAEPIVDLRALGDRNFAFGCLASFILGVGMFGTVYLVPVFLAEVRGFSSLDVGLAVSTVGAFQILSVPFAAGFARRYDLRYLIVFGYAAFGLGTWLMTPITHDWGWKELFIPQAIRGFAVMFCIMPANSFALNSLPPDRMRLASGLANLMRNLGGAIGIALSGTLLNDRTNLHFLRLSEAGSARNGAMADFMRETRAHMETVLGDPAHAALFAAKKLYLLTWREALVMSFSDAFLLLAAGFAIVVLVVPFARPSFIDQAHDGEGAH